SEFKSSGNTVVALGGGALSQPANQLAIEKSGFPQFFLTAPVEELFQRCVSQKLQRPLLKDFNAFRELFLSRLPQYCSAVRVDTANRSISDICTEIRSLLSSQEAD